MGLSRELTMIVTRAVDGTRTRDLHLGKVALHQLRYYRMERRQDA